MMRHELLAPAGSLEIAKAVLDAGADAVYLAGESFGARAYAANLSQDELMEIIDYAHLRSKKVHLTVNTLLKNRELEETLFSYIRPVYEHGLDAVIVQDFGVLSFLHRNFPELSLHASTQMSVTTGYGAGFLKEMGAERIVTARELPLEEIRAIYDATGMEVEVFIHGALCYCLSGQCLMSSLFGGRSGNRGRCAQPCRLPYGLEYADGRIVSLPKEKKGQKRQKAEAEWFPLSPKDLCGIDLLPALCEAGALSFKIEGRMKQRAYAQGVTAIYRKYLDRYEADPAHYTVDREDRQRLLDLGNRSGFTDGYYKKPWGRQMLSDRDSSHSSKLVGKGSPETVDAAESRLPVRMEAVVSPGQPASLTVTGNGHSVTIEGSIVQNADKRPLSEDELKKRLGKTGDSPYRAEEITVSMQGDCFLPVGGINSLRRDGLALLTEELLASYRRTVPHEKPRFAQDLMREKSRAEASRQMMSAGQTIADDAQKTACLIRTCRMETVPLILSHIVPDLLFLDPTERAEDRLREAAEKIRRAGGGAGLALPFLLREAQTADIRKLLADVSFDGYLVRSYDGIGFLLACGIPKEKIWLDAGVYVFSEECAAAFFAAGIRHFTYSIEQNRKEWKHQQKAGGTMLLYGRIQLMISAQCIYRNYTGCRKEKRKKDAQCVRLRDRYGNLFFVDARCEDCYNIIYNNKPLYLLDQKNELQSLWPEAFRLDFTTERDEEIAQILSDFRAGQGSFSDCHTRGHFNRGVE